MQPGNFHDEKNSKKDREQRNVEHELSLAQKPFRMLRGAVLVITHAEIPREKQRNERKADDEFDAMFDQEHAKEKTCRHGVKDAGGKQRFFAVKLERAPVL